MHQANSSTSSSNAIETVQHKGWNRVFRSFVWLLLWLIVIDVALNIVGSASAVPISIRRFLDYGFSTEAKLRREVGPTDAESDPIALAGWLGEAQNTNPRPACNAAEDGKLVLSFYGMSFAQNLARCIGDLSDNVICRFWGGPGASPNHTFAAFTADGACTATSVSVFAIQADVVAGMLSTTGATKAFEVPAPFMYPRYQLDNGKLHALDPPCNSLSEFRQILEDPDRWTAWLHFLSQNDEFYSPFVFRQNVFDLSALVRLLRRGYALSLQRRVTGKVYEANGFNINSTVILVLREMIRQFAIESRNRGQVPVVCLFNNRGYSSQLYDLLHEQLDEEGIPYVSSHVVAPATDPQSFGPDDYHFSPAARERIAREFIALLREQGVRIIAKPQQPSLPTTLRQPFANN